MVRQSARRTATKEELVEVAPGRLQAMASAHNLLSRDDWQGAKLADLAGAVLSPFVGQDSPRFTLHGPESELKAESVVGLGLIFQELATNAAKYGAWSDATGRVSLSWEQTDGQELRIQWRESRARALSRPSGTVSGSTSSPA